MPETVSKNQNRRCQNDWTRKESVTNNASKTVVKTYFAADIRHFPGTRHHLHLTVLIVEIPLR
jgi:hypothetical protein